MPRRDFISMANRIIAGICNPPDPRAAEVAAEVPEKVFRAAGWVT
jgi:hypothetical protein